MTTSIERVNRHTILDLISSDTSVKLTVSEKALFEHCLMATESLWVGRIDNKLVCAWGLIPPTIMSEQAHLWLYTTDAVKEHEFIFVRNSQKALAEMFKEYPVIVGFTAVGQSRSIRWLRWLGAVFGNPGINGKVIPFTIRKK